MKRNARDATGSSCGQRTTQGACVFNRAVQDCGRRLNQSHFRPMAEVSFLPSANTRKRASASREEADQLAIYKASPRSELGTTDNKSG